MPSVVVTFQYSPSVSPLSYEGSMSSSMREPSSDTPFHLSPEDLTSSVARPLNEMVALPSGLSQHRSPPKLFLLLAALPRMSSWSSAQGLYCRSMYPGHI
ncbi:hypothetical protein [Actinoplanes auranticolor]|uniref:hypothetical protein n=1 Tax=Actinoplanes auranticolor TaxID=47988 RepID=UPI001BB45AFB|nr:hypothetical protein [Actinoplanes auranticolor]